MGFALGATLTAIANTTANTAKFWVRVPLGPDLTAGGRLRPARYRQCAGDQDGVELVTLAAVLRGAIAIDRTRRIPHSISTSELITFLSRCRTTIAAVSYRHRVDSVAAMRSPRQEWLLQHKTRLARPVAARQTPYIGHQITAAIERGSPACREPEGTRPVGTSRIVRNCA